MELFSGKESAEDYIVVAFGLEDGLREFYLSMASQVQDEGASSLFSKLADIEVLHQDRLLGLYKKVTGEQAEKEDFAARVAAPALEGGMTTEEYLSRFHPDMNSITDILSLAMSIEAQALDLYQRASFQAADAKTRDALQQIADEERTHLQYLADYMDKNVG